MGINSTIYFDRFALDPVRRALEKDGEAISLNPKTFDLLLALIEHRDEVVSKDELLERVWPNLFVEENNLTVHVAALRKAFGEKKGDHRFIVTIPGRGYSFVAQIRRDNTENASAELTPPYSAENTVESPDSFRLAVAENFDSSENLIGRTRELTEIEDLLRAGEVRLVTLTGAGGTGKTAMARAIARRLSADFADGVFFIELAAVDNPEMIVPVIARTLGILETDKNTPIEVLTEFLRDRRALLILDNFEQILSAAPLLQKIVDSTEALKILVTSRAALRIDAERERAVAPLGVPPPGLVPANKNLSEYAAVALFVRRARNVRQDFVLTAGNAPVVAEICRKLDGLPLALELAAARIRLLSPQSILERLRHSLNLLTGGAKNLPSRQRTMRGAIEWSYKLLDAEEKTIFRRLAVFSGGFTIEAAEFVAEAENGGKAEESVVEFASALDLVTALTENNLLTCQTPADGDARLGMLEVVREYALECLDASGESDVLRRNHARFFLALAEEAEPHLLGERSIEWLEKLETEHDNFRAALRWSLENDPETAAAMAAALRYFWANHNYLTEGRKWLEAISERRGKDFSIVCFKVMSGIGQFARSLGDFRAAEKIYREILAASEATRNSEQMIIALHGLAALATRKGNFAAARESTERQLAISRELGNESKIAYALSSLGDLALAEGDAAAARPAICESLEISRQLGNKQVESINLLNLGVAAYYENDYGSAVLHFTESLKIARELGNKSLVSCCLDGFAAIFARRGTASKAAHLAGAADKLRESINYEIEITERLFRDSYLAEIRRALDEKSYEDVYQAGRRLNLSEAFALIEDASTEMNGQFTEIITETHEYRRIVIDEETEDDLANDIEIQPFKQIDASSK